MAFGSIDVPSVAEPRDLEMFCLLDRQHSQCIGRGPPYFGNGPILNHLFLITAFFLKSPLLCQNKQ